MDQTFAEIVVSIAAKVKETRGGMKRLLEVTGRSSGVISQWKSGGYTPTLENQVEFVKKANLVIAELQERKDKQLSQLNELTMQIPV